jgi:hypothetical protein
MKTKIVNATGLLWLILAACSAPVETAGEETTTREQAVTPAVMRVVGKRLSDSSGTFLARSSRRLR